MQPTSVILKGPATSQSKTPSFINNYANGPIVVSQNHPVYLSGLWSDPSSSSINAKNGVNQRSVKSLHQMHSDIEERVGGHQLVLNNIEEQNDEGDDLGQTLKHSKGEF